MPTAVTCRLCELQQHHHRGGGHVFCPASAAAAGTPLSVLPGHRPNERRRERSRDVSLYNQFRRRPPDEVTRYHQQNSHYTQQQPQLHHHHHQQHQHQQQLPDNGASVLLATPAPSSSRDSGGRWRQRRRRSPSRRQRIHASLLRQFSPRRSSPPPQPPPLQQQQLQPSYSLDYSKCPLCQPRYSPSPDRLGLKPVTPRIIDPPSLSLSSTSTTASTNTSAAPRGRPPKPRDYKSNATSINIDKKSNVENVLPPRPNNSRRSKSEYRQRKSPSRSNPIPATSSKLYDIDLDVKRHHGERDLISSSSWTTYRDEVNGNHGYSELKEPKKVSNRQQQNSMTSDSSQYRRSDPNVDKKRARSKSRSRYGQMANNGLLTVWPGKEGVWLPQ